MASASTVRRRSASPERVSAPNRVAVDRLCFSFPVSACTLRGFRAWATSDFFPEHVRATFVDGEIFFDMSNEEPETHVAVKTEVSRVLSTLVRQHDLGKFYANGVLVSNEAGGVANNPDGTFFTAATFQSRRVRLVPREGAEGRYAEIEGTPDWVMEVVSDSSVRKDSAQLREAYHRAGIREYWLIDARGGQLVFQVLHWHKKGYVAAPKRGGWQRSQVFGRSFCLERRRDQLGLWEYTLRVQPA